ncbi:MAG: Zn-ribbon domain-containing OB-fold protein, partial [Ilumatobacteraceae bacterium]
WESRGWWEGAGRGELVLQRCTSCGNVQHKPRALCVKCLTDTIEHFVASGRGTVHTFTVTHQNGAPPFNEHLPYVFAYVELDEGPRVLTNIVGVDAADVVIGQQVVADFATSPRDDGEVFAVPRFRPA